MAFHYGAGAMSRAAINIANPSQRWIEPNPEEVSKGKQVIKKAAAGIKKGGRELARAPSRLSNLRRLSYASSRGGGGESRPVSRLSAWMDKYIIGEEKEGENGIESSRVEGTNIEEEASEGGEGGTEQGGQASEEKEEEEEEEEEVKKTPSRTASMIKRAFSFRKSRAFRASTAPSTLQPPQEEAQSDADKKRRSGTTTATPPSGEGSPLVRVAANEEIPDRTTSREAPVLPLPSFPSLITMPSGGEMEGSGAGPVGGEKVVVEEEEEEEEVVAVASLAFVGRARLVDLSAEE